MNASEGMRRLGLFLGALGAVAGCFASYLDLSSIIEARARHKTFESLATSDVVRDERYGRIHGSLPPGYVPDSDTVNKNGIKTIHWDVKRALSGGSIEVASLEMEDGATLYPVDLAAPWQYVLVFLFPAFGFFVPWGAIRAVTWIGQGFFQIPK
jgi:hypothetical protein